VLVFSHGNVSTRVQNTGLLEELASHGYVCCAADHPYDAACVAYPDGRVIDFEWALPDDLDAPGVLAFRAAQVELRAGDCDALLGALAAWNAEPGGLLAGALDTGRAAVMGHSFGGAAAAAAAAGGGFRAAVLLDAWQWPLGGAAGVAAGRSHPGDASAGGPPTLALPCPSLLFESDAFLGDRDAFCAFNGRMSSAMALASSPAAVKVVAAVGHYEYTDMALTAPLLLRRLGLLALRPSELRAFQRHMGCLVRSFLDAHTGGASGAAVAGGAAWSPPASRLCATCSADELRVHVAGTKYSARQEKAMHLLFLQVRRGDYECWRVGRNLSASSGMPAVLSQVIHTHGYRDIRRIMRRIAVAEGELVSSDDDDGSPRRASPVRRRSAERRAASTARTPVAITSAG
jgi:hypothetical protein